MASLSYTLSLFIPLLQLRGNATEEGGIVRLPASTGEARKRAALVIERFMRVHVGAHCQPDTAAGSRSVLEGRVPPKPGAMAVIRIGHAEG